MNPTVSTRSARSPPEIEAADGRVEGREELVLDQHAGVGERVHEGRLPGVGVADQRDRHVGHVGALFPVQLAGAFDLGDPALQAHDLFADAPAIDLELGFTGATGSDAATAETRQVGPGARQARQHVLELRQLDLQLSLEAPGAGGEDVEDQLAPVEDLGVEALGEGALLAGAQVLVDQHHGRAVGFGRLPELLDFTLADVGCRADLPDVLMQRGNGLDAGRSCQTLELSQRLFGPDTCAILLQMAVVDPDEHGALSRRRHVAGAAFHRDRPTERVISAILTQAAARIQNDGRRCANARFSLTPKCGRAYGRQPLHSSHARSLGGAVQLIAAPVGGRVMKPFPHFALGVLAVGVLTLQSPTRLAAQTFALDAFFEGGQS
jgi:hypothetical protein